MGAGALLSQLVLWGRRTGWQLASAPIPTHLTVGGVVASLSHGAGVARRGVAEVGLLTARLLLLLLV